MGQVLINQHLAELDRLEKVGSPHRGSVVRETFKDLLKGWGRQHDLVFIPEYKLGRDYPQDNILFEDSTQAVLSVETVCIVGKMKGSPR